VYGCPGRLGGTTRFGFCGAVGSGPRTLAKQQNLLVNGIYRDLLGYTGRRGIKHDLRRCS